VDVKFVVRIEMDGLDKEGCPRCSHN